jgi:transposase
MDISSSAVMDAVSSRNGSLKRQHRSAELKRQIVEETLAPGASLARAHGVNADQVFQYRQRRLKAERHALPDLLAVRLAGAEGSGEDTRAPRQPGGLMQVELAKGKLQVIGSVDREALRSVLEALLG